MYEDVSNTIDQLNNEAIKFLDRGNVRIALDRLGQALRLLQDFIIDGGSHSAPLIPVGSETSNGNGIKPSNGDEIMQIMEENSSSTTNSKKKEQEHQHDNTDHSHDDQEGTRNAPSDDKDHDQQQMNHEMMQQQTELVFRLRAEGNLSSAYFYGHGAVLGTKKLVHRQQSPSARNAMAPQQGGGVLVGDQQQGDDVAAEPCTVVQSATIMYNLGLAHHKSAIHNGFNNTSRGSRHIHTALEFYGMSLELIQYSVSANFYDHFEDQRVLIGILNNIGQVHFSLDNYEVAQHYFQHCFSIISSSTTTETTEQDNQRVPHPVWLLFAPEDIAGLFFNATALLALNLTESQRTAKAA